MDITSSMVVYCLAGGNKFKLELSPKYINRPIIELKSYILHQRKFPVECQIVFVCQDGKIFKALKDDELVPNLRREGSRNSLHVYMKSSAQTASLGKTRQSDFEEWLKKLKELNMSTYYEANRPAPARAPLPSPAAAVFSATAPPTPPSASSTIPLTARPPVPAASHIVVPKVAPCSREVRLSYANEPLDGPPKLAAADVACAESSPPVVHPPPTTLRLSTKYRTHSEHCQSCYRKGNTTVIPTHYCFSCDYDCCVLCSDCVEEKHSDHETEHLRYSLDQQPRPTAQPPIVHEELPPHNQPPPPNTQPLRIPDQGQQGLGYAGWECPTCTLVNAPLIKQCKVCDSDRPATYQVPSWYVPTDEEQAILDAAQGVAAAVVKEPQSLRWQCGGCTFLNLPHRPSCEVCLAERPANFQIPEDYVPLEAELTFIGDSTAADLAFQQALEEERQEEAIARAQNRQALLAADDKNLIDNDEAFDCPICFTECEPGDGAKLRECLHVFCKDCLKGHVESSETPEVRCPYIDDDYHCDEIIQEREVREIAPEFYPKLLEKSLQVAESQAANSFHCKTLNCVGWCTYEEDVNFFDCPVCNIQNCLTCQAIHENQNCKEYQDDLKLKAANDIDARKTQEEIERLLGAGEAMKCPQCDIIIMKKAGCDWIQCSVCHTEICWVTKQARWGPGGAGDTSGGCKCGVNGRPCHPNCGNCH